MVLIGSSLCHGLKIPLDKVLIGLISAMAQKCPWSSTVAEKVGQIFHTAQKSQVASLWKMLARSYWIDLQITVGKDKISDYGMGYYMQGSTESAHFMHFNLFAFNILKLSCLSWVPGPIRSNEVLALVGGRVTSYLLIVLRCAALVCFASSLSWTQIK